MERKPANSPIVIESTPELEALFKSLSKNDTTTPRTNAVAGERAVNRRALRRGRQPQE